jgi:hypothetical protein
MRRLSIAAGCALALSAAPAFAQNTASTCPDSMTLGQCWDLISGVAVITNQDSAEARATRSSDHQLQAKTTGVPTGATGVVSAINDFLPLVAGALGVAGTTNPDGSFALETNVPLPIGVQQQRVRLRGVLHKAQLFDALDQSLPPDTREATRNTLEEDFGDFDDVELSVGLNLETGHFGRSFHTYSDLYGRLFQEAWTATTINVKEVGEREKSIAFTRALKSLPDTGECAGFEDGEEIPIRCLPEDTRASVVTALREAAEAGRAVDRALGDRMRQGGLFRLANLINNQPQLNVEGSARLRSGLVGPDEYSVTGRFELGFVNLNSYQGFCRQRQQAASLDCLEAYLRRSGVRQSLDHGDRLWLAATFTSHSDFVAVVPDQGINFALAGSSSFDVNAGLGRYVALNSQGLETGRIDASLEFQANDASTMRNDRLIGSLSYTHRVTDTVSLLVGLVYANKPEFITDVDRKVSGNIGLRYRLQPPLPAE